MRRKYDTDAFLKKLEAIRAIRPEIAITTDVIAGFPEETDEEWKETVEFCKKANFAEIHVFPFSSRPGTFAASLKDTDPKVKTARVAELLTLSKQMREAYKQGFYGRKLPVLFEDFDEETHMAKGHTSNYLLVSIPSEKSLHGEVRDVTYDSSVASD
jgi:threonylcarbamoyladenosine tRNA methylthiotransferase MtaB